MAILKLVQDFENWAFWKSGQRLEIGQNFGNGAKFWKWCKILEIGQNSGYPAKFWILGKFWKFCKIDTQGLPEAMGVPLKLDATHWFQIWPTSDLTSYPRYPTFKTQFFNPVTIDDNDYKEWRLKHLWVQLWRSSKNSKHPAFHCGGSLISKKVTKTIAKVCFAQCSTSRLALCSCGCCCSLVVTMPKISLKTLYCYIFEKPKVQGHQNWYSQLSNTQIHKYKYKYTNTNTQIQLCWSARNTKHMLYF